MLGIRFEHGPPEDFISEGESLDTFADHVDNAGELVPEPLWESRWYPLGRRTAAEQAVERLHPGSFDAKADLPGSGLGIIGVDELQNVGITVCVENHNLTHAHILRSGEKGGIML
jgi:hypothetical protein